MLVRRLSRRRLRHDQCGVFSGLRQQHHKFVSAIAEGVVDQSQLRFDQVSNLHQQLAPDQVSVSVVDLLEVVEIDEQTR